jgi:hypothetical protein
MRFYEAVVSSASFRVRIALGLKGLACESAVVDLAPYPRVRGVYDECMKLDAFAKAHPDQRSKA